MTLAKRIFVEKRALIIPVVLGAILNIAGYAFVVRPLAIKSAERAERAAADTQALAAAERELTVANALVTGTHAPARSWRRFTRRSCRRIKPRRAG